jgi:hypothetical protein
MAFMHAQHPEIAKKWDKEQKASGKPFPKGKKHKMPLATKDTRESVDKGHKMADTEDQVNTSAGKGETPKAGSKMVSDHTVRDDTANHGKSAYGQGRPSGGK